MCEVVMVSHIKQAKAQVGLWGWDKVRLNF
jgi:hypothetical protein